MLCFLSLSASAVAEWEKIGGDETFSRYVDRSGIQKSGKIVVMASVEDYNAPQTLDGMNYLRSIKNQREYHCKNAKVRQHSTIHYSGNMGQGDIIENFNYPNADWQRIVTRTLGDTLWKIACGKE